MTKRVVSILVMMLLALFLVYSAASRKGNSTTVTIWECYSNGH